MYIFKVFDENKFALISQIKHAKIYGFCLKVLADIKITNTEQLTARFPRL